MPGIPPAQSTDDEDVAWGLQTAEALWKRGERIDALVWLRRAAQAAGDANDDDRALELARYAAELSDWMANAADEGAAGEAPQREGEGSPVDVEAAEFEDDEASTSPRAGATIEEDTDARGSDTDRPARIPSAPPPEDEASAVLSLVPEADEEDEFVQVSEEEIELTDEPPATSEPLSEHEPSVLPAERVHAGMFNPWDESEAAAASSASPQAEPAEEPDEPTPPPAVAPPLPSETTRAAPPLPPRPKPPLPSTPAAVAPAAPPSLPAASSSPAVVPSAPAAPPPLPAASSSPSLALDDVDAFADLPDDARDAFARAAKIDDLAEGEEVQKFALAYAIEGTFDVAATFVDAPAARVDTGAVLRARGSLGEGVPMRLVCTSKTGRVATWTDAAVDEAFRTIPWVEDDLRAAADRVQTLVGITVGPLGERLDPSIRDTIVERLEMRSFTPGERIVEAGDMAPGLLLVGVGELEIVDGDEVKETVGSGDFLFPGEVLGGGNAPNSVRAGRLGAIALFGDRKLAQELLVTCPPLLEVFAGM